MSLSMLGMVDQNFETGAVVITPTNGGYVDGEFVEGSPQPSTHLATKQVASSEELRTLAIGGERYTNVARFFINDGSVHGIGSQLVDAHGNKYRIVDADCRPERHYCKLLAASEDV